MPDFDLAWNRYDTPNNPIGEEVNQTPALDANDVVSFRIYPATLTDENPTTLPFTVSWEDDPYTIVPDPEPVNNTVPVCTYDKSTITILGESITASLSHEYNITPNSFRWQARGSRTSNVWEDTVVHVTTTNLYQLNLTGSDEKTVYFNSWKWLGHDFRFTWVRNGVREYATTHVSLPALATFPPYPQPTLPTSPVVDSVQGPSATWPGNNDGYKLLLPWDDFLIDSGRTIQWANATSNHSITEDPRQYRFQDNGGYNATDLAVIRWCFSEWEKIVNCTFQEVTDGPDVPLRVGYLSNNEMNLEFISGLYAQTTDVQPITATIRTSFNVMNTASYGTVFHEIAHAMGLDHPDARYNQSNMEGLEYKYSGSFQEWPVTPDIMAAWHLVGSKNTSIAIGPDVCRGFTATDEEDAGGIHMSWNVPLLNGGKDVLAYRVVCGQDEIYTKSTEARFTTKVGEERECWVAGINVVGEGVRPTSLYVIRTQPIVTTLALTGGTELGSATALLFTYIPIPHTAALSGGTEVGGGDLTAKAAGVSGSNPYLVEPGAIGQTVDFLTASDSFSTDTGDEVTVEFVAPEAGTYTVTNTWSHKQAWWSGGSTMYINGVSDSSLSAFSPELDPSYGSISSHGETGTHSRTTKTLVAGTKYRMVLEGDFIRAPSDHDVFTLAIVKD